jgi:hypothetical protein
MRNTECPMQEPKHFFETLLIFVGFSVIGIIAGYLTGITWANYQAGKFSRWQELESSLNFKKISDTTLQTVWAKTTEGELYFWNADCSNEPNCRQWVPAKDTPDTDYQYGGQSTKRFNACPASSLKDPTDPPGDIVECVLFISSGSDITVSRSVYYVLLDDGKIWKLRFGYSPINNFSYSITWICPGFLIGVAAFVVFLIYRGRNKVKTDT